MNEAERFLRNAQAQAAQARQPAPASAPASAPAPAPAPAPVPPPPQPQQAWAHPQMPPPPPQQPWAQAPQPQIQPPPQQAWAQPQGWPQQPAYPQAQPSPQGWQQSGMSQSRQKAVSMGTAWRNFWTQWTCEGRASRSEYWFVYVAFSLVLCFFAMLAGVLAAIAPEAALIPAGLYLVMTVVSIFPWWFLSVRRLHDVGHSGWCKLLVIVPVIGPLILLIWLCTKSDPLPNKYGPVPNVE